MSITVLFITMKEAQCSAGDIKTSHYNECLTLIQRDKEDNNKQLQTL